MNNKLITRTLATTFCTACFTTLTAQDRPNIIVFLVDDMGLMDTSVPFVTDAGGNAVKQPLNEWYRTPIWSAWHSKESVLLLFMHKVSVLRHEPLS